LAIVNGELNIMVEISALLLNIPTSTGVLPHTSRWTFRYKTFWIHH